MLFWVIAAALTIICVAATLYPLVKEPAAANDGGSHDIEVYKDQLAEVARDEARGLISPADAETARIEVSRRILNASKDGAANPRGGARMPGMAAISIAALLPIASWGTYSLLGSPDIPDQPVSARNLGGAEEDSIAGLIAKAEQHLTANPDDARGWEVLAPIYMRIGRFNDAANAYSRIIAISGDNAARRSAIGEAMTAATDGIVSAAAKLEFERALAMDPNEPKAHLFVALHLAQQGKRGEAKKALETRLASAPEDAPWRNVYETAIASLNNAGAGTIENGPSRQQVEASSQMSGEERLVMIETMVAGLAEKLKADPGNLEDWQKLIRSYVVLNKAGDAAKAFAAAQAALQNDATKLSSIRSFGKELGLETN